LKSYTDNPNDINTVFQDTVDESDINHKQMCSLEWGGMLLLLFL